MGSKGIMSDHEVSENGWLLTQFHDDKTYWAVPVRRVDMYHELVKELDFDEVLDLAGHEREFFNSPECIGFDTCPCSKTPCRSPRLPSNTYRIGMVLFGPSELQRVVEEFMIRRKEILQRVYGITDSETASTSNQSMEDFLPPISSTQCEDLPRRDGEPEGKRPISPDDKLLMKQIGISEDVFHFINDRLMNLGEFSRPVKKQNVGPQGVERCLNS